MRELKVHFSDGRGEGDAMFVTLCGRLEGVVAGKPGHVTCEACKAALRKRDATFAYVDAQIRNGESTFRDFKLPPLYVPPPNLAGGKIRCKCGMCEVCRYFHNFDVDYQTGAWKKRHRLLPAGCRWPSVTRALEWWLDQIEDGFYVGSASGWAARIGNVKPDKGQRMDEHIRECVATVTSVRQVSGGVARSIGEADDRVFMGRVLSRCYREPDAHGLTRAQRLYILFARTAGPREMTPTGLVRMPVPAHELARELGHGLTGPLIRPIVREGRDTVYEGLSKEGMVAQR